MNTIFNIVHRTRTRQHSDDFDRRSEAALTKKSFEGALTGAEEAINYLFARARRATNCLV